MICSTPLTSMPTTDPVATVGYTDEQCLISFMMTWALLVGASFEYTGSHERTSASTCTAARGAEALEIGQSYTNLLEMQMTYNAASFMLGIVWQVCDSEKLDHLWETKMIFVLVESINEGCRSDSSWHHTSLVSHSISGHETLPRQCIQTLQPFSSDRNNQTYSN